MDLIYVAAIGVFCALCIAFAAGCGKLRRSASGGRP